MYCRNCGNQVNDQDAYCSQCGAAQQSQPMQQQLASKDSGHWAWGILGFFQPIIGFVLFLVWKDTKPKSSRSAGIGTIVGIVFAIIFIIIILLASSRIGQYGLYRRFY